MKRSLTLAAGLLCYCQTLSAQTEKSSSAVQNVDLALADVVSTGFFSGNGSGSGAPPSVDLPLGGTGALSEGIESPEIKVTMQCNSGYDVSVSSSSTNFTYSGNSTTNTTMPVSDVLSFMVTENNTGGSVSNNFTSYQAVDGMNMKKAIGSGKPGVRTFSFKYKAQPGFKYPAGVYTTDIVFTVVKK